MDRKMATTKLHLFTTSLKTFTALILLLLALTVHAQNGTYQRKNKNGSYCYLSFQKNGNQVKTEIFSWWNTPSAQTGSYYGTGLLKGNICVLKSEENDPDCKVTLVVAKDELKATFGDCAVDHLTEDFNGTYVKITNAVAGQYIVTASRAYFYKKPNTATRLKSYVMKGDKVTLDIDRIIPGDWANVYYTGTNGKDTYGFIPLTNLKKIN